MTAHITSTLRRLRLGVAAAAAMVVVLALPAAGSAAGCPNEAARTQQDATTLPECRGYEMVSPVLKNGNEVKVPLANSGFEVPFAAANEGGKFVYGVVGAVPNSESASVYDPNIATSLVPGKPWETFPLAPESRFTVRPGVGPLEGGGYEFYAPDLSCGIEVTRLAQAASSTSPEPLLPEGETAEEGIQNLYRWDNASRTRTLVTTQRPVNPGLSPGGLSTYVDGLSNNCEHVVYENDTIGSELPGAPRGSLYEWSQATGSRVASILPDGKAAKEIEREKPALGVAQFMGGQILSNINELSQDGKYLFFQAHSDGGPGNGPLGKTQVYMRIEGNSTIDVSQSETATADNGAFFQAASKDGTRVFFMANFGLTAESSSGSETSTETECIISQAGTFGGTGCDLYEYRYDPETKKGKLTDLSADRESETGDKRGANVRGVLGISEDGAYVYFSASGQLKKLGHSQLENEAPEAAKRNANMYVYHEGALAYVANIAEVEAGGGPSSGSNQFDAVAGSTLHGLKQLVGRVSPNGLHALIATTRKITEYNNTDAKSGLPAPELYEYTVGSAPGTVTCVSCRPNGTQPVMGSGALYAALGPFQELSLGYIPRNLLNDGRVFFETPDTLLESGPHGKVTETVHSYEWQPNGFSECVAVAGCVSLLDGGASEFPTYVEDVSADGKDVYLSTPAVLAPQDQDGSRDIYDVRVGGGIFAPPAQAGCEGPGSECQPPSNPGAGSFNHASASGIGGGNLPPTAGEKEVAGTTVGSVGIAKHSTKGPTLTLVVAAPGAGKLTVSGGRLKTLTRSVAKAGSYTLKVALGASGRAAVRHHRRVKVTVRVAFSPSSGKASSRTVTVVFR